MLAQFTVVFESSCEFSLHVSIHLVVDLRRVHVARKLYLYYSREHATSNQWSMQQRMCTYWKRS